MVSMPRVHPMAFSRALLLSVLEEVEINGAMPDWWHAPNSHPKAGAVSRDCGM